jgi:hypothetical protein
MVHIFPGARRNSNIRRESLNSNKSNKIFPLKSFFPKIKNTKRDDNSIIFQSELGRELNEFLKFNSNDFMFINSSFLESMVLKERSYTLILFILNFLAVTVTVLFQEVRVIRFISLANPIYANHYQTPYCILICAFAC